MSHPYSRLSSLVFRPAARLLAFSCVLTAASLFAAPPAKNAFEVTAEGYPAWAGLTDANWVCGRHLCPSDMRHRLTAVCFVKAEDFEAQFRTIDKGIAGYNPVVWVHGEAPETYVMPRDTLGLVVLVGKADPDAVKKFIGKNSLELQCKIWYVYSNVTCSKMPDTGGKYPAYCVFGPEPGEPLAAGAYDDDAQKKMAGFLRDKDKKYKLASWKPYYGSIEEPQYMKTFAKTLASGKPLESLTAACQKGIAAKEPEKAKECQILYDALEQTRSDYIHDVQSFAATSPTRAVYEAQIVMKQWPKTKKLLKDRLDKMNAIPDMSNLCKMFNNLKKWEDPSFTCKNAAEAKKIEAELMKMKTTCDGLVQKSTVACVQSAAAWIAYEAETLAPQMASKVPSK